MDLSPEEKLLLTKNHTIQADNLGSLNNTLTKKIGALNRNNTLE